MFKIQAVNNAKIFDIFNRKHIMNCNHGFKISFLMPADPAYYEPLGYRYWNNQYVWEFKKE